MYPSKYNPAKHEDKAVHPGRGGTLAPPLLQISQAQSPQAEPPEKVEHFGSFPPVKPS